jgi:hypothetical protein
MSDDCLSSTGSVMASSRADTWSGNSNRLESLHLYTLQDLLNPHHATIGTAEIVAQCWNYSCVAIGHPTRPSYSVCLLGVSPRGVALLVSNKALEQ